MDADNVLLDFDVINSLKELGGDEGDAFLKEIIDLYDNQYPELFNNIRINASLRDPLKLSQAAHALKGASLNIGAKELDAVCKEIEINGKENNLQPIPDMIYLLEEIHKETMKAIKEIIR